ncbi:hypothetical protein Pcinc_006278 [Petrolisthes cinctipes]|uniref:DUF5641 domain-containing protein n=1 Tax=Petrolisthes cinctipes TaxID=88211 RepID=A0AAE1GDA8_PETCI|nr:hypothetical protein Pcinc_006278 [Petrolisthes cinctipes]
MSRGRVSPIKSVTLPRLELIGALLCARLVTFVESALHINVPHEQQNSNGVENCEEEVVTPCLKVTEAHSSVFEFSRYSGFCKAVNVVAWVLRFICNCKSKGDKDTGDDGLLRVKGRLEEADMLYESKHPIITPSGHVAQLLIRFQHILLKHAGVSVLVSTLRSGTELETTLHEIEAYINSRPLTYVGDEHDSALPLTPSHFLIGRPAGFKVEDVNEAGVQSTAKDLSLREKIRQQQLDKFWELWSNDYIRNLPPTVKGFQQKCKLKEGSLVLIKEDNIPRMSWPCGIVLEVFPAWPVEVLSDMLRVLVLWHWGGIYSDTDVISIKPFSIPVNAVGLEAKGVIASAFLSFTKNNPHILK